jgi:hypothetical protein
MNELFEDIVKPYTLTTVLKNANPNDSMRAALINIVAESFGFSYTNAERLLEIEFNNNFNIEEYK